MPLSPAFPAPELQYILGHSEALLLKKQLPRKACVTLQCRQLRQPSSPTGLHHSIPSAWRYVSTIASSSWYSSFAFFRIAMIRFIALAS